MRIFSRVVEPPVNETVALREEHIDVQRRAVNQPISPTDATAFKEQSIEMRESAEESVVEKSVRVVEEVVTSKEVNQVRKTSLTPFATPNWKSSSWAQSVLPACRTTAITVPISKAATVPREVHTTITRRPTPMARKCVASTVAANGRRRDRPAN